MMCDISLPETTFGDKHAVVSHTVWDKTAFGDKSAEVCPPGYSHYGPAHADHESAKLLEDHDLSSKDDVIGSVIKTIQGLINQTRGSFQGESPLAYFTYTYEQLVGYRLTVILMSPRITAKASFLHSTYEEEAKAFFDAQE